MKFSTIIPSVAMLAFLLTACGGGGGGGGGGSQNQAPTANAGADQTVASASVVSLSGSASSDTDGAISTYSWTQLSGTSVTLAGASTVSVTFTAPTVLSDTVLSFQLTVTDNQGATASDTISVTVAPPSADVVVSGKATFDRVGHNANNSLNLSTPVVAPVREAVVELLNPLDAVLATSKTDANGDYSFSSAPGNTSVKVRVKAQLLQAGTPSWNFQVVDNTNAKALYSMVSSTVNTGSSNQTINVHAAVGTGNTYLNTRTAAPFAILDSVYAAYKKVLLGESLFVFEPLKLNWSVNNIAASGDKATGQIGTSHFDGTEIYILGKADNDTDEFDDHVIIHEWGHYFEGFHSRSDSVGGSHGGGDKLDIRVAFGEGFGNAWSGIVTDDSIYRDSSGTNSSQGFSINVDTNVTSEDPGWASEGVVQSILYDLYDSGTETGDTVALGVVPLLNVLTGYQRNTDAFTSIFSFITGLKGANPGEVAGIDEIVSARKITATGIEDFASTEVNNGGTAGNLPVYFAITPGQTVSSICSTATHGDYNKLGNRRYIKMTISTAGSYTINVPSLGTDSDPDFYIYLKGALVSGTLGASEGNNQTETWTGTLQPGVYAIDLHEYNNIDGTNRSSCFSMTLN